MFELKKKKVMEELISEKKKWANHTHLRPGHMGAPSLSSGRQRPCSHSSSCPWEAGHRAGRTSLVRTRRMGPVLGDPGNGRIVCKAASPEPGQSELFVKSR